MREILFRGKRIDNEQWIEGTLISTTAVQTKYYIVDSCWCESQRITDKGCADFNWIEAYEVIPETIGQYTGLTDKNGTKIFEGDIIKCRHEWTGSNKDKNQSFNIDDLFEMVNTTNDDLQQQFESQNIRGAYGKHTEQICLGQRYLYYRNYVVEYYAPNGRYRVRNGSVFYDITSSFLSNRNAEVIGNIHDNPELLKGGAE